MSLDVPSCPLTSTKPLFHDSFSLSLPLPQSETSTFAALHGAATAGCHPGPCFTLNTEHVFSPRFFFPPPAWGERGRDGGGGRGGFRGGKKQQTSLSTRYFAQTYNIKKKKRETAFGLVDKLIHIYYFHTGARTKSGRNWTQGKTWGMFARERSPEETGGVRSQWARRNTFQAHKSVWMSEKHKWCNFHL